MTEIRTQEDVNDLTERMTRAYAEGARDLAALNTAVIYASAGNKGSLEYLVQQQAADARTLMAAAAHFETEHTDWLRTDDGQAALIEVSRQLARWGDSDPIVIYTSRLAEAACSAAGPLENNSWPSPRDIGAWPLTGWDTNEPGVPVRDPQLDADRQFLILREATTMAATPATDSGPLARARAMHGTVTKAPEAATPTTSAPASTDLSFDAR